MTDDNKKSTDEASNPFHNIMKASGTPKHPKVENCPVCSLLGNFIPPPKVIGRKLIVTFKCPNGHVFTKELDLL